MCRKKFFNIGSRCSLITAVKTLFEIVHNHFHTCSMRFTNHWEITFDIGINHRIYSMEHEQAFREENASGEQNMRFFSSKMHLLTLLTFCSWWIKLHGLISQIAEPTQQTCALNYKIIQCYKTLQNAIKCYKIWKIASNLFICVQNTVIFWIFNSHCLYVENIENRNVGNLKRASIH